MNATSAGLTAALKRFEGLYPETIELSLGRIEAAMEVLARPQDRLPPVIHIAGTNGKGSTCAVLRAVAEAAGYKVHVATSPHLVRFNERIRLAGTLITDQALIGYLDRVYEAVQTTKTRQITHFEATIAAAMLAFSEVPADLLILETGLGGRFDATNLVSAPAISVITPIDYDHARFLGTDLSRIAWEKAGIIKPDCPVASAMQQDVAAGMIAEEAFAKSAPLHLLTPEHIAALPANPALPGQHQRANAALAALALNAIEGLHVPDEAIAHGIGHVSWPARLQELASGPLTELAPRVPIWLDGGHNPHAARAIAAFLTELDGPTALIFAMMDGKDASGFLAPIAREVSDIITCPIRSNPNAARPEALADKARTLGHNVHHAANLEGAINLAAQSGPRQILIAGSLYLAGEVLAANQQVPT